MVSMTKAEKTRQSIIERAAPLFNTKGIAATAMSDIMDATGLAKGSLYVHFDNKDKLSQASTEFMLSRQKQKVELAIARHTTAKDKLIAFFKASVAPSNLTVAGGCPMLNLGLEADDTRPVIRRSVLKTTDEMQATITRLVQEGIRSGEFRASVAAEEFATRSFAMLEGGIFLSKLSGNGKKLAVILGSLIAEVTGWSK